MSFNSSPRITAQVKTNARSGSCPLIKTQSSTYHSTLPASNPKTTCNNNSNQNPIYNLNNCNFNKGTSWARIILRPTVPSWRSTVIYKKPIKAPMKSCRLTSSRYSMAPSLDRVAFRNKHPPTRSSSNKRQVWIMVRWARLLVTLRSSTLSNRLSNRRSWFRIQRTMWLKICRWFPLWVYCRKLKQVWSEDPV